ncbi:hypothetical protein KSF_073060 [Reticulibacter mediterranei]|uniref:Uncharacterized protein n=1 Tax=Reticulibacter mediterranei TaxID=2778369 RepID=A0A8J3IRH4_9CHLR|nr:hypothetical protein [Reticulibacter mediterranei]GHO97258.1 hypothetical protein KSF_073060 [Reticulibacter mediterranei]
MNRWPREAITVGVTLLFLLVASVMQITVQDADYAEDLTSVEPITSFTDEEMKEALDAGRLTAEQCVWMESQGISWEIQVHHLP